MGRGLRQSPKGALRRGRLILGPRRGRFNRPYHLSPPTAPGPGTQVSSCWRDDGRSRSRLPSSAYSPNLEDVTKSSAPDETENAGNMASEKWRMTGRFQLSRLNVAMVSAALVATIVFTFVLVTHLNQNNQIPNVRVSGIPSTVSTPLANLMSLSPVPPRSAPGFRLTDQKGRNISLLSFRGKDVVLEFMDPHCVDICPLVSQEFVDAFHDLGVTSTHVVFLAVNVNQYRSEEHTSELQSRQYLVC